MPTGIVTSYDLTVGVKVNMDEAIYTLSPLDSPLLTGTDSDGLSVVGSQPVDQIQFSWLSDAMLVPRSSLGANIATTTATDVVLASAADRLKFSTGDLIRIVAAAAPTGSEVMRVTGYSVTTATNLIGPCENPGQCQG